MKYTAINKRGFTLVETVSTTAIIVTLLSATALGVSDYVNNTKKVANDVILKNYSELEVADREVFGSEGQSFSSRMEPVEVTDKAEPRSVGDSQQIGNTIVSAIDSGVTLAAAAEAKPVDPNEERRAAEIGDLADQYSQFAESHNVKYIEGTESYDIPQIIASAVVNAKDCYLSNPPADGKAMYYKYDVSTGKIIWSGTTMECTDGQNLIRASLDDSRAVNNNVGCNVRSQMDANFLESNCIYVGVGYYNGELVSIPNVCIDINGNFNTVITHRVDNGIRVHNDGSNARETFNADKPSWKNFVTYVNYVTDSNLNMLDLSVLDVSDYTTRTSTTAQNVDWQSQVQSLRVP
jgi:Tfp pilus assembly protein PilE